MSGVQFDAPTAWLHAIWAIPLLAALGVWSIAARRRAMVALVGVQLLPRLAPRLTWTWSALRVGMVSAALLGLFVASLGPRWGREETTVFRRNIDVLVLIDVSKSMLAKDVAPSRLERAKLAVRDDLLPALQGERIGVMAFAGLATLTCPLTRDYGFVWSAVEELDSNSVPRGGSMIGDAIRRIPAAFPSDGTNSHRVVILMTDGEDHESLPVEAAANLWAQHSIALVVIAIGDDRSGAMVPDPASRGKSFIEYKGERVVSRANLDLLAQLARAGGGEAFESAGRKNFIPAGVRNFDLGQIFREVIAPAVQASEEKDTQSTQMPAQFMWFAWPALALLLIEPFVRETRAQ